MGIELLSTLAVDVFIVVLLRRSASHRIGVMMHGFVVLGGIGYDGEEYYCDGFSNFLLLWLGDMVVAT